MKIMTYEEFKASGKNGVYRADLDEWFVEGEEPPIKPEVVPATAEKPQKIAQKTETAAAINDAVNDQSADAPAAAKTGGKK